MYPYRLKRISPSHVLQDFSIQQLERRINRMQGEQSNEEKIQLEAKIKELCDDLEAKTNTHHLLDLQIKRLHVSWFVNYHKTYVKRDEHFIA